MTAHQLVQNTLQQFGGLNSMLSKSRLRIKFDQIFQQAFKAEEPDFNLLQSLITEVQGFHIGQLEFIRGVVNNFFSSFKQQCQITYTKFFDDQLQEYDFTKSSFQQLMEYEEKQVFIGKMVHCFQVMEKMFKSSLKIVNTLETVFPSLGSLQFQLYDCFKNLITTNLQVNLRSLIKAFFTFGFVEYESIIINTLKNLLNDNMDEEEESEFSIINIEGDLEQTLNNQFNGHLPQQYKQTLSQMNYLAIVLSQFKWEEYLEYTHRYILYTQVDQKLDQIKCEYSQPTLKKVQHYIEVVVLRWLSAISLNTVINKLGAPDLYLKLEKEMENYLLSQFVHLRASEMFDIFRDFPDSLPAIKDFKYALEKTKLHNQFATSIKEQFSQRLLLPGVITLIIIEHYIQAIRVLKLIDPSTILLEIISEPIKDHLRKRQDTLRCIVQSILADESELYEQLGQAYVRIPLRGAKGKLINQKSEKNDEEMNDGYISSDEDEAAAENWEPLPLQNDMRDFFISAKRKKTDIISTLVNIYGSQDAFLKIYKSMLEERLLSGNEIKQEVEIKNLELMKLRFGDQNLHSCDVMMRDIKESERIRTASRKALEQRQRGQPQGSKLLPLSQLNPCIISKGYWDQVQEEDTNNPNYQPPQFLQKTFDDFATQYKQFKRMRTVNFVPQLGSVNLTLHFENGSFKFRVTPIQASIISMFDDNKSKSLTADQIAKELDITVEDVRRKIAFWVCKGVLKEQRVFKQIGTSHYRSSALLSNSDVEIVYTSMDKIEFKGDPKNSIEANELQDMGQQDQIIRIQQHQTEDDDKIVRSFIMNIIGNSNGGCTFDKIYNMLKSAYMVGQNLQKSGVEELLKRMANEQKLSFNGQIYSLFNK